MKEREKFNPTRQHLISYEHWQVTGGVQSREVVVGPAGGALEFVFNEGAADTLHFNARLKMCNETIVTFS